MSGELSLVLISLTVMILSPGAVWGHGYLLDPPARSSLWRDGHNVIRNHDDNNMACGGKEVQWGLHGGKCGICGDRYDGPRHSEAGGKYATGIISRTYQKDQVLPITIVLTAPHGGWFEFRICPNNDISKPATQECLDMHLLRLVQGPNPTRFTNVTTGGWQKGSVYKLDYLLPEGLTCQQCVLQWLYNTGKDWGCDDTGVCAVGLGPQEQFYGCADIAITDDGNTRKTTKPTTSSSKITRTTTSSPKTTTTTQQPKTKFVPATTTTKVTTRQLERTTTTAAKQKTTGLNDNIPKEPCVGTGIFRGSVMDNRCRYLCSLGTCPEMMCAESCRELLPK